MMQHHEQESRETLPRFLHEPLAAISNTIREMQAHGASPADVVVYALAAIDAQAQADRRRLVASLNALSEAIRNDTGWVGGFAPDQWEQIRQAVWDTMTGARFTEAYADSIVALVKAHLEQQIGGSPL